MVQVVQEFQTVEGHGIRLLGDRGGNGAAGYGVESLWILIHGHYSDLPFQTQAMQGFRRTGST